MTKVLLLVEDDKFVSEFVETVLEEGGYTVVVVEDGKHAMARLKKGGEIDGLITDIRLSEGPDGWEVARHARELKPTIAVVYMSGDSASDWAAQGVPKSIMLQKPFVEAQLLTAISSLLIETRVAEVVAVVTVASGKIGEVLIVVEEVIDVEWWWGQGLIVVDARDRSGG